MPTWQPLQTKGPTRVVNGPGRLWAVLIAQWIHAVAAILTVQHKPCVLPPRLKPPAASSALWACLAGAGDGRWDHLQLAVYFGLASGGVLPCLKSICSSRKLWPPASSQSMCIMQRCAYIGGEDSNAAR